MSMAQVVMVVSMLVLASFLLASAALYVSVGERNARIAANTQAISENTRRQMRNCERIAAIVVELDKVTPGVNLHQKLSAINARYPDVKPCPAKGA